MNVKNYVWAFLCLYLTILLPIHPANAQALKVGDTLPEELWSLPLQVVNHPEGKQTITLSEYKDKLIILDFWATWCSPCVAMLPKQDSLQREFKDKLQILPVTYQSAEEVSSFMEKYARRSGKNIIIPEVVNDTVLRTLFPHTFIPHYVWIDVKGQVKAITGYEEVNAKKVSSFIVEGKTMFSAKVDPLRVPYDNTKPFLLNGNGGKGENLVYHSVLTRYTSGLQGGYSIRVDSSGTGKLSLLNVPLDWFYRAAYGSDSVWFGENRMEVLMNEPHRIFHHDSCGTYDAWKIENAYCYQLILPHTGRQGLFYALAKDLERLFPDIEATIEFREKQCWVLSALPGAKIPESTGGLRAAGIEPIGYKLNNALLKSFVSHMNVLVLQKSSIPFIDATGITYRIDIDINTRLNDIEALGVELKKYGFSLTREYKNISVLVLRDKPERKL